MGHGAYFTLEVVNHRGNRRGVHGWDLDSNLHTCIIMDTHTDRHRRMNRQTGGHSIIKARHKEQANLRVCDYHIHMVHDVSSWTH